VPPGAPAGSFPRPPLSAGVAQEASKRDSSLTPPPPPHFACSPLAPAPGTLPKPGRVRPPFAPAPLNRAGGRWPACVRPARNRQTAGVPRAPAFPSSWSEPATLPRGPAAPGPPLAPPQGPAKFQPRPPRPAGTIPTIVASPPPAPLRPPRPGPHCPRGETSPAASLGPASPPAHPAFRLSWHLYSSPAPGPPPTPRRLPRVALADREHGGGPPAGAGDAPAPRPCPGVRPPRLHPNLPRTPNPPGRLVQGPARGLLSWGGGKLFLPWPNPAFVSPLARAGTCPRGPVSGARLPFRCQKKKRDVGCPGNPFLFFPGGCCRTGLPRPKPAPALTSVPRPPRSFDQAGTTNVFGRTARDRRRWVCFYEAVTHPRRFLGRRGKPPQNSHERFPTTTPRVPFETPRVEGLWPSR